MITEELFMRVFLWWRGCGQVLFRPKVKVLAVFWTICSKISLVSQGTLQTFCHCFLFFFFVAHNPQNPAPRRTSVPVSSESPLRPDRSPSPARNPESAALHVKNLVRPFTLNQLKELLGSNGTMAENGFWIDKIKSHCYILVSTSFHFLLPWSMHYILLKPSAHFQKHREVWFPGTCTCVVYISTLFGLSSSK